MTLEDDNKNKETPSTSLPRTSGVADYFATLGVGETLVWKHTQKKTTNEENQDVLVQEEDEAALLERFYREIVHVTIVGSPARAGTNPSSDIMSNGASLTTSASDLQPDVSSPAPSEVTDPMNTAGWTILYESAATSTEGGSAWSHNSASTSDVSEANLNPLSGIRAKFASHDPPQTQSTHSSSNALQGFKRKLFRNQIVVPILSKQQRRASDTQDAPFFLAFRRRLPDEVDTPAIADVLLRYVRIRKSTVSEKRETIASACSPGSDSRTNNSTSSRNLVKNVARAARAGKQTLLESYRSASSPPPPPLENSSVTSPAYIVHLEEMISLPEGFDEWCIPEDYKILRFGRNTSQVSQSTPLQLRSTILFPHENTSQSSEGVEAYVESSAFPSAPSSPREATMNMSAEEEDISVSREEIRGIPYDEVDAEVFFPKLLPELLPSVYIIREDYDYLYIPVLAIRRQRVGDEERFHEDPAVVELGVSFRDSQGQVGLPSDEDGLQSEEIDEGTFSLVGKSKWCEGAAGGAKHAQSVGTAAILVKRNVPVGFADAAFAAQVLDRFPVKNYKKNPLPEEELPMFCYPTGCRLHRARYSDAPLPQYYGFVVKNERGDSIHVSCVSFMEPLTTAKMGQLKRMSAYRQRASIPNRRYCQRNKKQFTPRRRNDQEGGAAGSSVSDLRSGSDTVDKGSSDILNDEDEEGFYLTAFDDMTTFENKTICLVSRYPFWTAFRRFLSHLHLIAGSPSELPLERFISHLLLTVPVPRAGGAPVLVPLTALNGPMILEMPPAKDFPLVDLPFQRVFACLDVPTIVTVVLGFLSLERKIIIMSSRPSLVLDACELLKSLLFPFDLCAPYVPRLTEPFMSCLDFPGAIFVGIHDDGTTNGLASTVRGTPPEDSAIVDLDTGEIDCSGDRYEVLKQCWGIIPSGPRSMLVSEIETLCRDAGLVPGQEPLDSQVDSAFAAPMPSAFIDGLDTPGPVMREHLDDRAIRDAFLRFFCAVLGGYERYLVVPDVDFLISGNEWFDAQGFLASAPQDKAPFLGALVTTQIFQSFIQRRTEASDVHCLLFDECLIEYHSSPVPYGRLGGDVENVAGEGEEPRMLYSLLVDQCCAEANQSVVTSDKSAPGDEPELGESGVDLTLSPTRSGLKSSISVDSSLASMRKQQQQWNDIVTAPSRQNLPQDIRFVYFVDGNPCFPHRLNPELFFPAEPSESMLVEISETPLPLLARTERELEDAQRRKKSAISKRGLQNQRRCLWQLPKLMGSHFLGSWMICIPSQVSQSDISQEQQSRYLLRALGALRILRNKQRIIPDEATYRSLIVACGRIPSDRRIELVKLFGLLRVDGIFPSAVTLGQYTRALAEGYSKRSTSIGDDDYGAFGSVEVTVTGSSEGGIAIGPRNVERDGILNAFDGSMSTLEDSGRRWRQRHSQNRDSAVRPDSLSYGIKAPPSDDQQKKGSGKTWLPVLMSSSFALSSPRTRRKSSRDSSVGDMRFVALWSRTSSCNSCSYIPLDEEIQGGWDVAGDENEGHGSVSCPRCGSSFVPLLGFAELTMAEALESPGAQREATNLPPQLQSSVPNTEASISDNSVGSAKYGCVTYLNPEALRSALERYVENEGEAGLSRDTLRERDPEVFFSLWWYCARFSLPLPLPLPTLLEPHADTNGPTPRHACAFVAWDRTLAFLGCRHGAQALAPHVSPTHYGEPSIELPALSRFSMQSFSQVDWDHADLSEILIALVDASDKRDFKPVLECVLRCNQRRGKQVGRTPEDSMLEGALSDLSNSSAIDELDCYRTILYLAKYQCTTVFHVFFPAGAKPCKGYHFWCAIGTPLPVFDHMFRDAARRIRARDGTFTPMHDVSDVALGFRSVFGHII